MKRLLITMMIVPLLFSCNNIYGKDSKQGFHYTDNTDYLVVERDSDHAKDFFEIKFVSNDYSDGSSIRARYIGTLEEIMGIDVIRVSGSLEANKFAGATLESLECKSWNFDTKAMSLWFDEGI